MDELAVGWFGKFGVEGFSGMDSHVDGGVLLELFRSGEHLRVVRLVPYFHLF